MSTPTCFFCEQPLTGSDLNAVLPYQDPEYIVCTSCDLNNAWMPAQPWYGLAPRSHDMTRTGSVVGSTVHDDMSQYPKDANGEYDLGYATFKPDLECDGMGTYSPK